jgi:hypothetical protein
MVPRDDGRARRVGLPVDFRLRADEIEVDIRLRRHGDRWTAVTEAVGDREIGLSGTPRGPLTAAVSRLRPRAAAALLADLELLDVSLRLV